MRASELIVARLAAQGLSGEAAATPEEVVRRVLAVQAQDLRAGRLAIRSRSAGLTAADVDRALTERRSVVVTWLNRGTLHLVAAEDYHWLQALTTPQLASGNARRLRQEGVSEANAALGVQIVAERVRAGPQTRDDLRDQLDRAGVPTGGQALVHVLLAASIAGHIVRGPIVDGRHAFVDVESWLGAPAPVDREQALALLARRYLAGHGPADARDLVKWAGITLGDARRGLVAIAAETEDVGGLLRLLDCKMFSQNDSRVTGEWRASLGGDRLEAAPVPNGTARGDHRPRASETPPDIARHSVRTSKPGVGLPAPRLLGGFDPILHGWASRELLVGSHQGVVTSNGIFRPTALAGGRVIATWGLAGGVITLRPFAPIPLPVLGALRAEAADVLRFLGLPPRELMVARPGR